MTIDEAIKHCLEVAGEQQKTANGADRAAFWYGIKNETCDKCVLNHQFVAWLKELKEAKRLLKLAVEDLKKTMGNMYICSCCEYCDRKREVCASREKQTCEDICKWRYADEAEKLLNNEKINNVE